MGSSTAATTTATGTTEGSGAFGTSSGGVAGRIGEDGIEGEEARSIMGERGGAKGGGPSESESESEWDGTGGGAEMGVWTEETSESLGEEGVSASTTLSFLESRSGWCLGSAGDASCGVFSPLLSELCSALPLVSGES